MVDSKENYKFDLGVKGLSNLTLSNDINVSLFFLRYTGVEKGPATFGVIKRLRDNDMELHTNRQVFAKKNLLLMQC